MDKKNVIVEKETHELKIISHAQKEKAKEKMHLRIPSSSALTEAELSQRHQQFIAAATSENTRRAYRSAIRHFQTWGGELPCTSETILRYLLSYADQLNPSTLALRLTALSQWHLFQGFADPTHDAQLRKTWRGIVRLQGKPKKKAKALTLEDIEKMAYSFVEKQDLLSLRNKALVQIAFFGAFRRSELVAIRVEDIEWEQNGIVVTLPRSKTDQDGQGITKAIPYGAEKSLICPVSALKQWLTASHITQGTVFRSISRWGTVSNKGLYESSVNNILVKCAQQAGLSHAHQLSSHSFRRGLATSAYRAGAKFQDIKRQGGWRHDGTVHGYIEEASLFEENAAMTLLRTP